jgi:hypothetical protein
LQGCQDGLSCAFDVDPSLAFKPTFTLPPGAALVNRGYGVKRTPSWCDHRDASAHASSQHATHRREPEGVSPRDLSSHLTAAVGLRCD